MILLLLLAAAVMLADAATTVPHQGEPPPNTGFNTKNTSVFTNYDSFKENGQAFLLNQGRFTYETPRKNVTYNVVHWLSAATFSAAPLPPAVNARIVRAFLGSTLQDLLDAGARTSSTSIRTELYSSSYSAQVNAMESVITPTDDDWTTRFWDDGLPVNSDLVWEGDDAGDQSDNAATSAVVGFGTLTWISVDEAAVLLNASVTELTPAKFNDDYAKVWELNNPPAPATSPTPPPKSGTGRMTFSVMAAFVAVMVTMMVTMMTSS